MSLTFARNSTAYLSNGALVNTNLPRYEHHRLAHHRWQDLFDTDQIATLYTSGGDVAGATAVSGGVLSYSGGTHATLLRTGLTIADGEVTVNTDQAGLAGCVFRHQNNTNYYLVNFSDDSGMRPSENTQIFRYQAGLWTLLGSVNLVWARGTAQQFRITFHGSLIEVWHGNVRVLSVTDTTFTTGGVGLWNHHATAFRVLDWTVHQAQQGLMVEEGVTNLLSANQSSVETDLTGFHNHAAGVTLVRDTAQFWHGAASVRVDRDGTADWQGLVTSPSITVSASQTYTASVLVRGTGLIHLAIHEFTDADALIGSTHTADVTMSNQWQRITVSRQFGATGTRIRLLVVAPVRQTTSFWVDGLQLEQRAFATSWQLGGSPRVAETLTVPTAGVFNRGNWSIEGKFVPQIPMNVGNIEKMLFDLTIDANNFYRLSVGANGEWRFLVRSGGVDRLITSANGAVVQGTAYLWQISGDGTTMRLCVNGVQVGELVYTEPVGALPANMHFGSNNTGGQQANGIISNLRISSRARTLAEHQAAWNNGQPLALEDSSRLLASLNGTLDTSASLTVPVTGIGNISVSGDVSATVPITGTGDVTVSNAASFDVPINSSGAVGLSVSVEGDTLNVNVGVTGAGDVTVSNEASATVPIAGTGDVGLSILAEEAILNVNVGVTGTGAVAVSMEGVIEPGIPGIVYILPFEPVFILNDKGGGSMLDFEFTKKQAEETTRAVDFSQRAEMLAGETIASAVVIVTLDGQATTGIMVGHSIDGARVRFRVQGGIPGREYRIRIVAITNQGHDRQADGAMMVI